MLDKFKGLCLVAISQVMEAPLQFPAGGMSLMSNGVTGLETFIKGSHKTVFSLFQTQWEKMHGYVLRDEHVPLMDLVTFAFTFIKARRQQNQRPLTGPSLKLLEQLQGCIIQFLHHACIRGVVNHMASTDVFNRSVPSRVIRTVTLLTCLTF